MKFSFKRVFVLFLISIGVLIVCVYLLMRVFGAQQVGFILNEFINPGNPDASPGACVKVGGQWVDAPGGGNCKMPTTDEGRRCYQESECVDICQPTEKRDEEGYIVGFCTAYHPAICQRSIPYKTKDLEIARSLQISRPCI